MSSYDGEDFAPDAFLEQQYEDRFYVPDDPYDDAWAEPGPDAGDPDDVDDTWDPDTTCESCGRAVGDDAVDGVCARCVSQYDGECQGHDDVMGTTVFCDGSCVKDWQDQVEAEAREEQALQEQGEHEMRLAETSDE